MSSSLPGARHRNDYSIRSGNESSNRSSPLSVSSFDASIVEETIRSAELLLAVPLSLSQRGISTNRVSIPSNTASSSTGGSGMSHPNGSSKITGANVVSAALSAVRTQSSNVNTSTNSTLSSAYDSKRSSPITFQQQQSSSMPTTAMSARVSPISSNVITKTTVQHHPATTVSDNSSDGNNIINYDDYQYGEDDNNGHDNDNEYGGGSDDEGGRRQTTAARSEIIGSQSATRADTERHERHRVVGTLLADRQRRQYDYNNDLLHDHTSLSPSSSTRPTDVSIGYSDDNNEETSPPPPPAPPVPRWALDGRGEQIVFEAADYLHDSELASPSSIHNDNDGSHDEPSHDINQSLPLSPRLAQPSETSTTTMPSSIPIRRGTDGGWVGEASAPIPRNRPPNDVTTSVSKPSSMPSKSQPQIVAATDDNENNNDNNEDDDEDGKTPIHWTIPSGTKQRRNGREALATPSSPSRYDTECTFKPNIKERPKKSTTSHTKHQSSSSGGMDAPLHDRMVDWNHSVKTRAAQRVEEKKLRDEAELKSYPFKPKINESSHSVTNNDGLTVGERLQRVAVDQLLRREEAKRKLEEEQQRAHSFQPTINHDKQPVDYRPIHMRAQ
jgi:hypothetical protein